MRAKRSRINAKFNRRDNFMLQHLIDAKNQFRGHRLQLLLPHCVRDGDDQLLVCQTQRHRMLAQAFAGRARPGDFRSRLSQFLIIAPARQNLWQ